MTLNRRIFIRVSGLVAGLIAIVTWLACAFAVSHHRASTKDIFSAQLTVVSDRAERLMLLDDRVALKELLRGMVDDHDEVEYAFVERGGQPYIHTFESGVPRDLLTVPSESAGAPATHELERATGGRFTDMALQVGDERAGLHLGLSREAIDRQVLPQVLSIVALGAGAVLVGLALAGAATRLITREVDQTTNALRAEITERERTQQELARYRDQLEDLVEQRTSALAESQAKMRQSERLASIGTFAAGVAHEINNPLTSILMSARHALRSIEDRLNVETSLQEVIDEADRCGHIVKGLLLFAKHQPSEKEALNLNDVLYRAAGLVRGYGGRRNVSIETATDDRIASVVANSTEMEQVFVNVIKNAIDASDEGQAINVQSEQDGRSILIHVRDRGRGMAPEEEKHAFDPFFTTRAGEGGSGLGLSIVHGTVTEHGGTVGISTESGAGTVITITLPRSPDPASERIA